MTVLHNTGKTTLRELPGFATGASLPAFPSQATGTNAGRASDSSRSSCQWQERCAAVKDLYRYVADLDLLICGPQYWFFSGMEGEKLTLEVALPVQGKIPTAVLPFFKRIPAFRCLSSWHEGAWAGIAEEYQRMQQYISDNGLRPNGIYAESYLHIDFDDPSNQTTELLIGLC